MSQYWQIRIDNANRFYEEWETKFKCNSLCQYFEGFQWKGKREQIQVNYNPYTLNLVYSTIKIKLASLIFQRPSFLIEPQPGNLSDWDLDYAMQSAELKQDYLNTLVQNPNANFAKHIKRAAKDSFTRFGLIEVGYAADWRNPQKEPILFSDHGKEFDDKAKVEENNEVPENERVFFKRIYPKRFRVCVSDALDLNDHEWVGYYDFIPTRTLRRTKGIKFPNDYKNSIVSQDYNDAIYGGGTGSTGPKPDFLRLLAEGEISKVWHIWDMVEKKRLLLLDGNFEELWSKDSDRLPFRDIRWDERDEGFYPIPPVFQWLSSQDEINEAREQQRSFRRRFTRKFQVVKGQADELEIEKFASGPDGIVITVKEKDAITPIENPELGQTAQNELLIAKDDFNIVSGTSADARGQSADRQTATSAKISAAKAEIRESAEQMDFSEWICLIAREILTCAKENVAGPIWVKHTTNPNELTVLAEVQSKGPIYKQVLAEQIDDGYDFHINVDVLNQTPAAMQQQEQSFISFLSVVHQFPEIAMSPVLIRKAAMVCGMRDEKVIHQMQQVAALSMAAKASQAAAQQGQTLGQAAQNAGANGGSTQVSQMSSPTADQTNTQITQQLQ